MRDSFFVKAFSTRPTPQALATNKPAPYTAGQTGPSMVETAIVVSPATPTTALAVPAFLSQTSFATPSCTPCHTRAMGATVFAIMPGECVELSVFIVYIIQRVVFLQLLLFPKHERRIILVW